MLTSYDIREIFHEMGRICAIRGHYLEIAVYGGSALVLDFSFRQTTQDIDFFIEERSLEDVLEVASEALSNLGRPELLKAFSADVRFVRSSNAEYLEDGLFGGNESLDDEGTEEDGFEFYDGCHDGDYGMWNSGCAEEDAGDSACAKIGGLRILKASPRYVLAMKIRALRTAPESNDLHDTWSLCEICDVRTMDDVDSLLESFYPGERISMRNRMIVEDILHFQKNGKPYSRSLGW